MSACKPAARETYRLVTVNGRLELCGDEGGGVCLQIDEVRRRVRQGRKLALAKACGVRPALRILDGMAGLGLDGITLAMLGCDVLMVERDPLLSALLNDAVNRVRSEIALPGAVACQSGDVRRLLADARYFDTIYLDPMFPARDKRALPRKSAQVLSSLVGAAADDLRELIAQSMPRARQRVVVKRRRHDPTIGKPDWQILGRSVRFDVYKGTAAADSD